jgi:hypothetical protein
MVKTLDVLPIELDKPLPDIDKTNELDTVPVLPEPDTLEGEIVVLVGSVPTAQVPILPDNDMVTEEVVEPKDIPEELPIKDNALELVKFPTNEEVERPDILFVIVPYKGLMLPVPVVLVIDNVLLVGSVPTELDAVLPDNDIVTEEVVEPTPAEPRTISAGFTYPACT